MKKVVLLALVLVVGGCGEQSETSLGDDNLELARQFLAFASSDENRAQALDMAHENFEFRWMGMENGLQPLQLSVIAYIGQHVFVLKL